MANWSDLPQDILILIAKRITNVYDNISFSAVCSSWRSVAKQYQNHCHQLPGLMIPAGKHDKSLTCRFLPITNIKSSITYRHYQKLPVLSMPHNSLCLGSSHGWLVMANKANMKLPMSLLNPATGVQISLPPVSYLPFYCDKNIQYVRKIVLSSRPFSTSQCFVLIIYKGSLAYTRLGDKFWSADEDWTPIKFKDQVDPYEGFIDATYHKGQFYILRASRLLYTFDLTVADPMVTKFLPRPITSNYQYLVESGGELLLVSRRYLCSSDQGIDKTYRFGVLKLDSDKKQWIKLESLGHYALFLGLNQSFSLSELDVVGIKGNSIYFTDYIVKPINLEKDSGHDMGVFNLENSIVEPFGQVTFKTREQPPIWITPRPLSEATIDIPSDFI